MKGNEMKRLLLILLCLIIAGPALAQVRRGSGGTSIERGSPLVDQGNGSYALSGDLTVEGTLNATTISSTGADERIYGTESYLDMNFADKTIYAGAIDGAGLLQFRVDGGLYMQGSGNVGIGTSFPTAMLSVGAGTPDKVSGLNNMYIAGSIEADGGIYLDGVGNAGVGTSNPTAMLAVGAGTPSRMSGLNNMYVAGSLEVDGNLYVDGYIYSRGVVVH